MVILKSDCLSLEVSAMILHVAIVVLIFEQVLNSLHFYSLKIIRKAIGQQRTTKNCEKLIFPS